MVAICEVLMPDQLFPGMFCLMAPSLDRPTKICAVCGRPFQWRRKWKDVWDEVRYCSERCRRRRGATAAKLILVNTSLSHHRYG